MSEECCVCLESVSKLLSFPSPCTNKPCESCAFKHYKHNEKVSRNGVREVFCPCCRRSIFRFDPADVDKDFEVKKIVGSVGEGRNWHYWVQWTACELSPLKLNHLGQCKGHLKDIRKMSHM